MASDGLDQYHFNVNVKLLIYYQVSFMQANTLLSGKIMIESGWQGKPQFELFAAAMFCHGKIG
jgi:hypothetical protein